MAENTGNTGQQGTSSSDANTLALFAHLLGIFTGFIGALVIWLIKKDEGGFVASESKEALNWQITVCIGYVIGYLTSCIVIGLVILPVLYICNLIFCILGAVSASKGTPYRYPVAIRLIK